MAYHIGLPIPPADFIPELSAPVLVPERTPGPSRASPDAYFIGDKEGLVDDLPNTGDYVEIDDPQRSPHDGRAGNTAYWLPSYWQIDDNVDDRTFPAYMPERAYGPQRAPYTAYRVYDALGDAQLPIQSEPQLPWPVLPERAPPALRAPAHTYWIEQQRQPYDDVADGRPEYPQIALPSRRAVHPAYQVVQQFLVPDQEPVPSDTFPIPSRIFTDITARRQAARLTGMSQPPLPDEPTFTLSIPDKTYRARRAAGEAYWLPQIADVEQYEFPLATMVSSPRQAKQAPNSAYWIEIQEATDEFFITPTLSQPQHTRKRAPADAYQTPTWLTDTELPQGAASLVDLPRPLRAPLAAYWIESTIDESLDDPQQPEVAQPQRAPQRAPVQAYELAAFTPVVAIPVEPQVASPRLSPLRAPAEAYDIGTVAIPVPEDMPEGAIVYPEAATKAQRAVDQAYWVANDRVDSTPIVPLDEPMSRAYTEGDRREKLVANTAYWIPMPFFQDSDSIAVPDCECPALPIPEDGETTLPTTDDSDPELPRNDDTDTDIPRIDQCEC